MMPWRNRTLEEWQAPVAGWPVRTVRRVIAGGRFEPYVDEHGVEVVPGLRDRRGVILGALGGVSAELDELPWNWDRNPRLVIPEKDILYAAEDVGRRVTLGGEDYRIVSVPSQPTIMGKPKL